MQDSEEVTDTEPAENLGGRLRSAREAQDLSIDAIAAELRIGPHLLSALEECRFDELDAPVFAKGYLKQYGARLGLDVAELVAEYDRAVTHQPVDIAPSATIRLRDERQITFWIIAVIALLAIAGMLGAWWWFGQDSLGDLFSSTGDEPAPIVSAVPEPVSEPLAEAVSEPVVDPAPEPVAESPPPVAEAEATPADELSAEPAAELPAEPVAAAADEPAPVAASASAPDALQIRFVADSWTEISNDNGERLLYDLGRAGTVATVPVDRPLSLFFGNAAGIELSFNGEPVEIPASARRDELAQFSLDLRGR